MPLLDKEASSLVRNERGSRRRLACGTMYAYVRFLIQEKGGLHINMTNRMYQTPFAMAEIPAPSIPNQTFRVDDYKDHSVGMESDYGIIQRAIEACSKQGGGTVIVPQGDWLTGPIHLRSYIHLRFETGAVVTFSDRFDDYLPVVFTRWEGMECYNYSPLVYAHECEHIAITGDGCLIGSGEAWWHWKQLQQEAANRLCYAESDGIPVQERVFGTERDALRPSFIHPINCRNVLIEGITIKNGPQWTIHPVYCENVWIKGVTVVSHGPNTDGLNPDSCSNVLVEDSYFETGDDCIAINSGMNEDGWRVNKPCENIVIRNCTMKEGHGGLVIGSGMSGGVRNVYAHNCRISGGDRGIRLKSMRGRGGFVENIWFENIEINDVREEAVQINMYYGYSTVAPRSVKPSDFKRITIRNITGKGAGIAVEIRGLPEQRLKDIVLENIRLAADSAMVCSDVEGIRITGLEIAAADQKMAEFNHVHALQLQQLNVI